MDQSGDILSALLSDPEKLSAAVGAVSSMLGGSAKPDGREETEKKVKLPEKQSEGAALIKALKPFLSPERQQRADKALRLLTLASLAAEFKDIW
jgi:hypothetical protein